MTIQIDATFQSGQFKVDNPLILPEGTRVHLTVVPVQEDIDPLEAMIGLGESGRVDGAQNHDQYIYGKH